MREEGAGRGGCFGVEIVLDLIEGRATGDVRAHIDAHASGCETCRGVLRSLTGTSTEAVEPGAIEAGLRVGRYVIRELLRTSGMAVVFAARDPELGRTVALKFLRAEAGDEQQARLRREARVMAQLAHPNVTVVHDVGMHGDRTFVAMEHVEGQTLASWLAATPRSPREIAGVFRSAGWGLAAAHEAGIVHRDFKPENVLIGTDGRVRVADFGLARTGDVGLTMPGAVVGTPYFMAPEQYRGEPADARSDQFSFCVALFTAIYGVRPFAGETLGEQTASVCARRLVKPPRVRGVETGATAAIRRGLAMRAEDRFASMADLLKALAPRRRRRTIAMFAVAIGAAAVAIVAAIPGDDSPRPCQGAADHLRGIWDDDRKAALRASVIGTNLPYAAATLAEVTPALDAYARAWVAMRTSSCEATRLGGNQHRDVLELRMMCLDQRLGQLSAFVGQLVAVDRASAEHAVRAAHELAPVEDCADVRALRSPMPRDPARRRQIALAMDGLAKIRATQKAGQVAQALAAIRAAIERASELGHRPLEAESLLLGGSIAEAAGDAAVAERWYAGAALAAEAGRQDVALVQALVGSISVVGRRANRFVHAEVLYRRAQAVLERIAKPPELESALSKTFALAEWSSGKLAQAKRDFAASIAVSERIHGQDHFHHAETLHWMGAVLLQEERGAEARAYIERALAIHRRALGDDHPHTARSIELLAGVEYMMSNYYVAIAGYQRAQRIYERVHGTDHERVANVLGNLANAYGMQGRGDRAVALLRRAVAIDTKVLGADHPTTLNHLDSLAHMLVTEGNHTEARVILERVLGLQREQLGDEHPQLASTLHSIALLELADGSPRTALARARQAYDIYVRTIGSGYRGTDLLRMIGDAHLRLGDPASAATVLETAAGNLTDADDPGARAWLESLLGQALVDSKRDRARGRELVGRAWVYLSSDDRTAEQRAQLVAWMKRRGIVAVPPPK